MLNLNFPSDQDLKDFDWYLHRSIRGARQHQMWVCNSNYRNNIQYRWENHWGANNDDPNSIWGWDKMDGMQDRMITHRISHYRNYIYNLRTRNHHIEFEYIVPQFSYGRIIQQTVDSRTNRYDQKN
jgi:hypothetical protein